MSIFSMSANMAPHIKQSENVTYQLYLQFNKQIKWSIKGVRVHIQERKETFALIK